ncbi:MULTISPECIES: universal stress protein [unclassified Acinetobacter]|uniref:universal stress protein n=1 Tax=unclassified Acinetobacter TaxID=196816 RepID=UPI0029340F7F|nr:MULTISPECIES: universal stress protein [unclassified Acinetobacter]WOE31374.1 universal stress protein [Acinetobacter sp. SAAs470]WOE39570.1 universal stress protein [Acinetobacter sp. SAAs474]
MAFNNILVPIDGSATAYSAVDKAVELAKAFNSKITVVQVLTLDPYIAAEYISASQTNELIERARKFILASLEEAKAKFAESGVTVETKLLEGQVIHREITQAAEDIHADIIIMGSHGRTGLKKLFLGSVAQSVLSEGTTPVMIIRD